MKNLNRNPIQLYIDWCTHPHMYHLALHVVGVICICFGNGLAVTFLLAFVFCF